MNKIIIAPDSFKGTLSAPHVARVISQAAQQVFPDLQIIQLPVSDGGEGFVDVLLSACGGEKVTAIVSDPLCHPIESYYGILPDGRAVIEMAVASGLTLIPEAQRDALHATSFGTGELIRHALQNGCRDIVLGLGGSASTDGGAGLAAALGIQYLDSTGRQIISGGGLADLAFIDASAMLGGLERSRFTLACDVDNPLFGEQGAAFVYAPQKGAAPADVLKLDQGLRRLAEVISLQTGLDLQAIPGEGAAGGAPSPLLAFCRAEVRSGVDLVLDQLRFEDQLEGCSLVITGEGRTDAQSAKGKAVAGIGRRCQARGVPVVVISGALGEGWQQLYVHGITACYATTTASESWEQVLAHAEANLRQTTGDVCQLLQLHRI